MHNNHLSYQHAILRICCFLKATEDKGLSFKPIQQLTLGCYIDADSAGLYNVEHQSDLVCIKSWTGFVLMLGNCPLLWSSKLPEIGFSTTEAKYCLITVNVHITSYAEFVERGQLKPPTELF